MVSGPILGAGLSTLRAPRATHSGLDSRDLWICNRVALCAMHARQGSSRYCVFGVFVFIFIFYFIHVLELPAKTHLSEGCFAPG